MMQRRYFWRRAKRGWSPSLGLHLTMPSGRVRFRVVAAVLVAFALPLAGCVTTALPPPHDDSDARAEAEAETKDLNNEIQALRNEIYQLEAKIDSVAEKTDHLCLKNENGLHQFRYCNP